MMVCEWLTSSVPTQLGAQGAHLRAFSLRKHRIIPRAGTESPPTDKCCVEGGRHLPKFTQQLSLPLTPTHPKCYIVLTLRGTDREKGGAFPAGATVPEL